MEDSAKLRLVRCPKCQNLLPELPNYSVYQCGGCNAVLRGKQKGGSESGSIWEEALDEGKGVVHDLSANSDVVDAKFNGEFSMGDQRRGSQKPNTGHEEDMFLNHYSKDEDGEVGVSENGFDVNRVKGEGANKSIGRTSNWPYKERGKMEAFWRKPHPEADMEGVRFSTLKHPDEGTSNANSYSSFSYSYGEQWRNYREMDGVNTVQHLEKDRAELIRKLEELSNQLNKSSEEKVLPDGKTVPQDPYSGSDAWFPEGSSGMNRSSRQFFGPNKHMAGPPYFNHHHPYAYTTSNEMAMLNFHPSMHNPNFMPVYGDPFASQMLRGSHQFPHQFPGQQIHPYFPESYGRKGPNLYDPYAYNAMPHQPSCSCFICYNNRSGSLPVPPAEFANRRFPHALNDPKLYRHEMQGTVGPHAHNSRIAIPAVNLNKKQVNTRCPRDYNSDIGGFVRSRPLKVMPASGGWLCHPIAGGSPFITCHNCFELLQLPKKTQVKAKKPQQKMKCGACSAEINYAVINKKLVVSLHSGKKETTTSSRSIDDTANEAVNSCVSHSHGHVHTSDANFSSDDYSGYDFHSVDRESPALAAGRSLNSGKSQEMQSFHSSSSTTSEYENSPQDMIAPSEAAKSIHQPTKASESPPPAALPLQSSLLDQETARIEKDTPRQNSLKDLVLATEMDVHDYSNTGVSQDSGDASRENDRSRSNRGGDSFLASIIKKGFRDFSQSNEIDDHGKSNVSVNGQPISERVIRKAEKLAGPIQPGNYWYDFRAGFWGVMGGPCLGIIMPFIDEFHYPMPDKCSRGNTGVFVNGRELHQKDLDLLSRRGLPLDSNRSYIVEISGRVLDEDTGEELDCLGKLAPTVEKAKHGFGMKVPRAAAS